jgi:hypothetical protein
LDQLGTNLASAEERRLILQQQVASQKVMEQQMAELSLWDLTSLGGTGTTGGQGESQELTALRKELLNVQLKYTENHPEVRRLKSMIEILEGQQAETPIEDVDAKLEMVEPVVRDNFSMSDLLKPQLQQVNSEIGGLRLEIQKVKGQVELYERRVEETPKREQEMILLTRDYETIKSRYDNLVQRKLEADVAVSMEKKQKGEQFRMLDAAKLPEKPVSPDVSRILLFSLVLGLCLGGGLAFTVEMRDTSYQNPEEAEGELGLPVIGSLGYRYTNKELRMKKAKGILKGASVAGGFAISALCIMVATKGADKTFNFIKTFFIGQT